PTEKPTADLGIFPGVSARLDRPSGGPYTRPRRGPSGCGNMKDSASFPGTSTRGRLDPEAPRWILQVAPPCPSESGAPGVEAAAATSGTRPSADRPVAGRNGSDGYSTGIPETIGTCA